MKSYLATAMIVTAAAMTPAFGQTADPAATTAPSATAPATPPSAAPAAPSTTAPMTAPAYTAPEGYALRADWTGVTADKITGSKVIGPEGENIGSVSDVVIGADGGIGAIILDVGGFLGMGAHTISLASGQVDLYTNADGDVITRSTLDKDALKALPEYTAAQ